MLQVLVRADREARLVEKAAAEVRGRVELEVGLRARGRRRVRVLAEHVREPEDEHRPEEGEQDVADGSVEAEPGQVAVALEDDAIRDVRHGTTFAWPRGSPA